MTDWHDGHRTGYGMGLTVLACSMLLVGLTLLALDGAGDRAAFRFMATVMVSLFVSVGIGQLFYSP
jgi:hypothetical protein